MLAANMIGGPLVAAAAGRAPRNRRAWPGGRSLRALPAPARAVLAFARGAEGSSAFGAAARVLPREKIGAHALAAAFDGKSVPRCAHTLALCDAVLGMGIGRGLRKGPRFQPVDRQAKKARCVGVSAARLARARRTEPQRRGCTAGDEGCTPALCECTVAASGREWGMCSGGAARAQRPSVLAQPDGRIPCGDCLG